MTADASCRPPRPAVFFDRDGVLNEDTGFVHRSHDLVWIEGAVEAVALCNKAGYLVFVVTNQSGIARGYYTEAAMHDLHAHMRAELAAKGGRIDDIRHCPHLEQGIVPGYTRACHCRKPNPGMILDLIAAWNVDTAKSFLIGDSERDLEAARRAGVDGLLFTGGNLAVFVRRQLALRAESARKTVQESMPTQWEEAASSEGSSSAL